ncbi:MAG: hypothetical protein MOGMAGMI_00849 [Candidatus Omnitrophica bacterium]|nr:hypothetical protein [Candidatus Omnitrophota bacterium]
MIVAVISSAAQLAALRGRPGGLEGLRVYCDNPRFRGRLESEGVAHESLHEYLIPEPERTRLNGWCCDRAAYTLRRSRELGLFASYDLPATVFLRLGYQLVHVVKNRWYAERILENASGALIFRSTGAPSYPKVSGNVMLNAALEDAAVRRGLPLETLEVPYQSEELLSGLLNPGQRMKLRTQEFLRSIMDGICSLSVGKDGRGRILVKGALKHLEGTVRELARRGQGIVYCDESYQVKHRRFAREIGAAYRILGTRALTDGRRDEGLGAELEKALEALAATAEREGWYRDGTIDHTCSATRLLLGYRGYAHELARRKNAYDRLAERLRPSALLLDEDTTLDNAPLAVYFAASGVPVYTLSHATMAVPFAVEPANRVFGPSTTFVNSEYERSAYGARGWDESRIAVTGVPRFDALVRARSERPPMPEGGERKVFYCGASLKLYYPERGGYLGLHLSNNGDAQRQALSLIWPAVRSVGARLSVKPHNYEGDAWPRFLAELDPEGRVRFVPHTADFMECLRTHDVMVLAHWSTAIIEAAIVGVPTILLDLYHRQDLAPYATGADFKVVRTEAELTEALRALRVRPSKVSAPTWSDEARIRCFGRWDGANTARVVDRIAPGPARV